MSRLRNLVAVLGTVTKANKQKLTTADTSDHYRKIEWEKYAAAYYNLLSSNTFYGNKSHSLLTAGFIYISGEEYVFSRSGSLTKLSPLNMDKLVYDSIVKRPTMIWLPCMDERLQYLTASHHALSLGMPGCECLLDTNEKEKIAEEVAHICSKNPTIREIVVSSHSGCGAVAKAIEDHKNELNWIEKITFKFTNKESLIDEKGEKYATSFAQLLEKHITLNSLPLTVRTHHFARKELHSEHLHHAFGAVINFDPLLNTAEFEDQLEFPMFNIYSGGHNEHQIYDNILLAMSIAGGESGFGKNYFTIQHPFVLLFTCNLEKNKTGGETIEKVLEKLAKKAPNIETIYKVLDTSN